jgi:hypothetical protein
MFDNNTMELSTISDERAKRINFNKLKAYHHNNPPTNVIITVVTIDTRPSGKIRNRHRKKTNLIFHLTCIPNQRIYPGMTQNLEKHLMKMILSGLKKKIPKIAYQECLKMKDQQKFNYKGGRKGIILLYSKNYVNEKGGHKNRKVGLEPRLVRVKETMHDMFNMPMNESCPIWPLKQLLCPQELEELKVIKHRYHMWKDYLNEQIAEWNARAIEVHER